MQVARRKRYWMLGVGLLNLLWLLPSISEAQNDKQVFLQGVVLGGDSLAPLPYVHIRGEGGRTGTATDAQGYFNVNVQRQDTIMFTSVGYQPYFLVPADSSETSLRNLTITLAPYVGELKEVTIRAYDNIEQYIRREAEPFSMYRKKGEPLFERPDPKDPKAVSLGGGMNGARLEGAVTSFANLFNSKYQQEKKLKEILAIKEAEARQEQLHKAMTGKFQEMLALASDLSEADIHRFTLLHMPDPQAMAYMDDYTIIRGILVNLPNFRTEEERATAVEKLLKNKVFEGDESATRQ